MLFDAADLFALQFRAEGDYQRALPPPHLPCQPQSAGGFQEGIAQWAKLLQGEGQQIGEMGGDERAGEMEPAAVENLLVADGVVALIKDQGDGLAVAGQRLIAEGQFLQGLGERQAVMLIARVDLPQQRDVKIHTHQQGQSDDAQIGALAFGVTALGQLAGSFRIDEGVKVSAIESQTAQIQVEGFDQALGERFADGRNLGFAEQFHVVPEAPRGELLGSRT